MTMSPDEFTFFQAWIHKKTGVAFQNDKTYLLESRLSPVLKTHGIAHLAALSHALRNAPDSELAQQVIDVLTTHETMFFRDPKLFDYFRTAILPELGGKRNNQLRIWSSACATGQEPYSIALALHETLPRPADWRIEIVATDISTAALDKARSGEYTPFEVQRGLPPHMVEKHFAPAGRNWKIKDNIRERVRFQIFNLLDQMDHFGTFDAVFCRNVMIYFNEETKKKVLTNLVNRLPQGGYLMVGATETVLGLCPNLKAHPQCPGLYSRFDAAA